MDELFAKLMELIVDYEFQYKEAIIKAYNFAKKYHAGITRESGEDYVSHPLNVAIILGEMKADADTICAGLLHDTLEDTDLTKEMIIREFNEEVAKLTDGVTKISNTEFSSPDEAKSANDRKLVLSMTEDIRIVIIKLADRLHNMRTLQYKSQKSIDRTSYETLDIFAPLANYIGAYQLKNELEDLALRFLQENIYYEIKQEADSTYVKYQSRLSQITMEIIEILSKNGITSEIKPDIRNVYGIYKRKNMYQNVEYIPDLLSLRISVPDLKSCYYALGLINSKFPPKNGIIEDLIANPKHNTYRSLHSSVQINNDIFIQFQIRDRNNDFIAAYGLTAYWRLNPIGVRERMQNDMSKQFQFFNSIKEIDKTFRDNEVFLEQIRRQLFSNKIKIFSPTKKIFYLLENSSVLDFVRSLDPIIIFDINYILVNSMVCEGDYILKEGDQVGIYTKKEYRNLSEQASSFVIYDKAKIMRAKENF